MATVKETLDLAARRCSFTPPASWVSQTTASAMEFKDLLGETVEELLDRIDWPEPITKDTTIAYTGSEPHTLPSDFLRLTRDPLAAYETTTTRRAVVPVASNGAWTHLEQIGSAGGDRFYRLAGDEDDGFTIEFYRPLETGASVTVSYVSHNWLREGSTEGKMWNDAAAVLLLPPVLVRLGIVWRFKQRKGLAYADIMAEYETRVSREANSRRGIKSVNMGVRDDRRMPWDIPVPDHIPASS